MTVFTDKGHHISLLNDDSIFTPVLCLAFQL